MTYFADFLLNAALIDIQKEFRSSCIGAIVFWMIIKNHFDFCYFFLKEVSISGI